MSRAFPPYQVRMPPDLKDRLHNAASINGRSLNMEIIQRLTDSLARPDSTNVPNQVRQDGSEYGGAQLSELDRNILAVFRRLPTEKQLALISLFK